MFTVLLVMHVLARALLLSVDTFVIRTLLVPAIVSALGDARGSRANWWPGKAAPVLLGTAEEAVRLWDGHWEPTDSVVHSTSVAEAAVEAPVVDDALSPMAASAAVHAESSSSSAGGLVSELSGGSAFGDGAAAPIAPVLAGSADVPPLRDPVSAP